MSIMNPIGDKILDKKVNAFSQMYECTIEEYYGLVKDVLGNNDYQRKRVKSASSIYALLKDDLKQGCMIPPIVMAYTDPDNNVEIDFTSDNIKDKLLILDGLQRSFTILDIVNEISSNLFEDKKILQSIIRIELYTGINRMGILYRMLTLNTGQTRMSTRHQIDIIYSDYLTNCPVNNVTLIREIDSAIKPMNLGEYKFRDVIEGFTSYLECDYLTLDRQDLLEQIKTLTKLRNENAEIELFNEFIDTYHKLVIKMNELYPGQLKDVCDNQFGETVIDIFNKSQSLTGFGSAIGIMQEREIIGGFQDIKNSIAEFNEDDIKDGLIKLLSYLEDIRKKAKKIGNDQRLFFHYLYRKFFDKEKDSFLKFSDSVIAAYREYQRDIY